MWTKICGITSLEDAQSAVAAGADAVGFVFAESPRRVTAEFVRDIVERLPERVEKIGVFVDAAPGAMATIAMVAGLTGVQLHGADSEFDAQGFRSRFDPAKKPVRVVRVVRFAGDAAGFAGELQEIRKRADAEVLVDTGVAGRQGGTGIVFDWAAAHAVLLREAPSLRLIAAGGLRPENVRDAVFTLRPWGVDVSSGVESSPGKKDPKRIAEFISAARMAEIELREMAKV